MVYIPGGSVTIKYSQSSTDTNSKKRVSLSSFYIDKTETTNQQFRMFTEWVIDSVAVVAYLKDDKYFLDPPNGGVTDTIPKGIVDTTVKDTLNTALGGDIHTNPNATTAKTTSTVTPTPTKTDTVAVRPVRRRLNWDRIRHSDIFESNDDDIKGKIAPMFDVNTGKIRPELYVFNFTYLRATGTNRNAKIGEYTTEPINIYPDEKIWFKDLNNSQVEILVENYFTQPPFDDYPVVGVTWKQARAFAYWRSITNADYSNIADYLKYYRLQYSLPSEAQWVYAAGKDMKVTKLEPKVPTEPEDTTSAATDSAKAAMAAAGTSTATPTTPTDSASMAAAPKPKDTTATASSDDGSEAKHKKHKKHHKGDENQEEATDTPVVAAKPDKDATPVDRDRNGNLLVNFKQEEGDYTEDGANFTLPVMSYAPNEYGVYNMVGNVAEWVLDAYSPSTFAFVSDVNPVLLYDADSTDADAMKRKVVRGGSFVSNAKALSPFTRDFELQNVTHCYIGFRCVMSAPEILNKSVATRRKETSAKKPSSSPSSSGSNTSSKR